MKSIISNVKECLICGDTRYLNKHHIYEGTANRKKSEEYGCWCYLCQRHHNGSSAGVHYNRVLERHLKQSCQIRWEQRYGTRDEFIKTFGRSYL